MLFTKKEIEVVKDFRVLEQYLDNTVDFTNIGKELPIEFYWTSSATKVCPLVVNSKKIVAVFTTNSSDANAFDETHDAKFIATLPSGEYLYDFNKNMVILDYSDINVRKGDWRITPPIYIDTKFTHVIGLDQHGKIHKFFNTSSSLIDSVFVGYMVNLHFEEGKYDLNTEGLDVMFKMLAKRYSLRVPLSRHIQTYSTSSFEPLGLPHPEVTLSQKFMDELTKPAEEPKTSYPPLLGYDDEFYGDLWDSYLTRFNEDNLYLTELTGIVLYPATDIIIPVIQDIDVHGVTKVELHPPYTLWIYYDKNKVTPERIREDLALPYSNTTYIPN